MKAKAKQMMYAAENMMYACASQKGPRLFPFRVKSIFRLGTISVSLDPTSKPRAPTDGSRTDAGRTRRTGMYRDGKDKGATRRTRTGRDGKKASQTQTVMCCTRAVWCCEQFPREGMR